MSTKIKVNQLNLRLNDGSKLLTDVSLEILAGQVSSIIGPSGSGKSTLLRCFNRLWEPPPNTIFLEGQDLTGLDVLTLRRRVGMLFQSAVMFEGTIAQNIGYGPGLQDKTLSSERIEQLLEMVGLEPALAQKSATELSGGEAQRVALARALANEPDVLLLDEPTSALDPAATRKVEETILHLRDTLGLTVVWVSHSTEQVERIADMLVLLVHGKVVEYGTPEHLLSSSPDHVHLSRKFVLGDDL